MRNARSELLSCPKITSDTEDGTIENTQKSCEGYFQFWVRVRVGLGLGLRSIVSSTSGLPLLFYKHQKNAMKILVPTSISSSSALLTKQFIAAIGNSMKYLFKTVHC